MRDSLKPVLARVTRLADTLDVGRRNLATMSDGELEAAGTRYVEGLADLFDVGPAAAFATAETFAAALAEAARRQALPAVDWPILAERCWKRARWFSEHAGHGRLTFAETWRVPFVEARCPCGASHPMYRELVPAEFRASLPAREDGSAGPGCFVSAGR